MSRILNQRGEPMTRTKQHYPPNPDPMENKWAAFDSAWLYMKCFLHRPFCSIMATLAIVGAFGLAKGIIGGTVMTLTGRAAPVSWNQVDSGNFQQVGYYIGQRVGAPTVATGGSVVYATFVDDGQVRATNVSNHRRRSQYQSIPVVNPEN